MTTIDPSLHAGWESYRSAVVPIEAHPFQVHDTRRAFFAGAVCVYNMLVCAGNSITKDLLLKRFEAVQVELRAHMNAEVEAPACAENTPSGALTRDGVLSVLAAHYRAEVAARDSCRRAGGPGNIAAAEGHLARMHELEDLAEDLEFKEDEWQKAKLAASGVFE